MERKRNRPEKYDRELLHTTVKAVQKIKQVIRVLLSNPLNSPLQVPFASRGVEIALTGSVTWSGA